jgi:hypothetical protein
MFEAGTTYAFELLNPFGAGGMSFSGIVLRVTGHLIEVRKPNGDLVVLNTAASTFVSAQRKT